MLDYIRMEEIYQVKIKGTKRFVIPCPLFVTFAILIITEPLCKTFYNGVLGVGSAFFKFAACSRNWTSKDINKWYYKNLHRKETKNARLRKRAFYLNVKNIICIVFGICDLKIWSFSFAQLLRGGGTGSWTWSSCCKNISLSIFSLGKDICLRKPSKSRPLGSFQAVFRSRRSWKYFHFCWCNFLKTAPWGTSFFSIKSTARFEISRFVWG